MSRLSEINGKDVFTSDGRHIGVMEDLSIDPETGKVTGILVNRLEREFINAIGVEVGKGVIIPYGAVKSIGDIILVTSKAYNPQPHA